MNESKLCFDLSILKHFINNSLELSYEKHEVTGFELLVPLLEASAYNTYVETVSDKTDTLYRRTKETMNEMTTYSYLDYIKRISEKLNWKSKPAMLAIDYTDEDFYGEVQGLDIHGWKKGEAITGHFKFLTCSMISDNIPEKIPLISIPIQLGHNMSYAVNYCITLIKNYIGQIELVLFDRGFYSKQLMLDLKELKIPYLILAKKGDDESYIREELATMQKNEKKIIPHEYELNIDKTTIKFESHLAFLKSIFSKRLDKELDWVFATNVEEIKLEEIIKTYKKRWRIETGFRVQDDATIKCKSKEMKIRYFLFVFEQLLQTIWMSFYKNEVSFKEFLIEMHKVNKDLVAHPRMSYGKV